MADNRRLLRRDTSLRGEIVLGRDNFIRCVVRNISASGAKLDVDAGALLPSAFQLRASDLGLDTRVKTVWRTGTEMGVSFDSAFANA